MHKLEDSFLQLIGKKEFQIASIAPIDQEGLSLLPIFLPSLLSVEDFDPAPQHSLPDDHEEESNSFLEIIWKDTPPSFNSVLLPKEGPSYTGLKGNKKRVKEAPESPPVIPEVLNVTTNALSNESSSVPQVTFDSNDLSWMDQLAKYSPEKHIVYFSILHKLYNSLSNLFLEESVQITLCRRLLAFLQECNSTFDAIPINLLVYLSSKSPTCRSMIMEDYKFSQSKDLKCDKGTFVYHNLNFTCWMSVFVLESINTADKSSNLSIDSLFSFQDGSTYASCLMDIIPDTESILSTYKILKNKDILSALVLSFKNFLTELTSKNKKADQKVKLLEFAGSNFRHIRNFYLGENLESGHSLEAKHLFNLSDKFVACLICNLKAQSVSLRYKSLKTLSQTVSLHDPLSLKETYVKTLLKLSEDSSPQVRQCLMEYLFELRELHWNEFTSCLLKMVYDRSAIVLRQISKISTLIFHKLEDSEKKSQILSILFKGVWSPSLANILSKEWLIPTMKDIASAKDLNVVLASLKAQLCFLFLEGASFQNILHVFKVAHCDPSFQKSYLQDLGSLSLASLSEEVREEEKLALLQILTLSCEFGLNSSNLVYTIMIDFLQDHDPLVVEQAITILSLCSSQIAERQMLKLNELVDVLLNLISRGSEMLISKSVTLLFDLAKSEEAIKKKIINFNKKIVHVASKMSGEYTILCRCLYASSLILANGIDAHWAEFDDPNIQAQLILNFRSQFGSCVQKCCISSLCAIIQVKRDLLRQSDIFEYISLALLDEPVNSTHVINWMTTLFDNIENKGESNFEEEAGTAEIQSYDTQLLSRLYENTFDSLKILWDNQSYCMAMSIFSRKVMQKGDIPPNKPLIFLALMLCSPWCETRLFSKSILEEQVSKYEVNVLIHNLPLILEMSSDQYCRSSMDEIQGQWNEGLEEAQSYYQLLYDMIKTKAMKREFLTTFCRAFFSDLDLNMKIFLIEEFSILQPKSLDDTQLLSRYIEEFISISDDVEHGVLVQHLSLLQAHLKSGSKKKILI